MKWLCGIIMLFLSVMAHGQEVDTVPFVLRGMDLPIGDPAIPLHINVPPYDYKLPPPVIVEAKINYWKVITNIGINVNQAMFTDNWKSGGRNSLAIGGTLNWKAAYNKQSFSYQSEVALQYGEIKNKGLLKKKTTDRIFWDNKIASQFSKNWYFFGSLSFESQFTDGFAYDMVNGHEVPRLISRFMAPGYLTESIGVEYKPADYFSLRLGTGAARQTFVTDRELWRTNKDNYGVPHGKTFKNELAFQLVGNFDKEVAPNLRLKSRYAMFVPYKGFAFNRIDHRLDVEIAAKINRFMATNLKGVLLYDIDMDARVQASEILSLGFIFAFPR